VLTREGQKEALVPTYQYACTTCGEQVEAVQRFTDEPLTVCTSCGGSLRKVYSPVGIVFKGSGFYRTDSRKAATASEDAGTKAAKSNGSSGSGEGSANGKKDSSSSAGQADAKKSGDAKASQPASAS
jgi:putative FmdB family regulatory protein